MASHASHPLPAYQTHDRDRGALIKVVALMLGIAVPILLTLALWAAVSAQKARDEAQQASSATPAATTPASSMPGMTHDASTGGAVATPSYAGLAPDISRAFAIAFRKLALRPLLEAPDRGNDDSHWRLALI